LFASVFVFFVRNRSAHRVGVFNIYGLHHCRVAGMMFNAISYTALLFTSNHT